MKIFPKPPSIYLTALTYPNEEKTEIDKQIDALADLNIDSFIDDLKKNPQKYKKDKKVDDRKRKFFS